VLRVCGLRLREPGLVFGVGRSGVTVLRGLRSGVWRLGGNI
jgi:hypothetical protein